MQAANEVTSKATSGYVLSDPGKFVTPLHISLTQCHQSVLSIHTFQVKAVHAEREV